MAKHGTEKQSKHYFFKGALLILVIALLAFAPGIGYAAERMEVLFYPRHYREEVESAAARFGMEPNLIYAIIKAESGFSETAVSSAGAIGLMQIIPDTFLFDIRDHIGLPDERSDALFEAESNILAGTYYFAHWYDYFYDVYEISDPTVEALAAYNAGIGRVWEWLEDDALSDWNGLFAEKIPFEETKKYVSRILSYKEKYDELYGKAVQENGYISENLAYRWAKLYGKKYSIDPRFVMSIIRAESTFNPNDLSPSGAAGLMQITKGTFADIKADLMLERNYEDLFDPEFNIQCGAYYLHWVDERMEGYAQIAAAYNVGTTAVNGWLADPAYSNDGESLIIENIPIDTTRRYVGYVLNYYEEYLAEYPKK